MNVVDARYAEVAYRLGLVSSDTHDWDAAQKLLSFIKALRTRLEIPQKLGDVGLRTEDIPVIAEAAFESGSLAANPKTVRFSDLVNILEKIYNWVYKVGSVRVSNANLFQICKKMWRF